MGPSKLRGSQFQVLNGRNKTHAVPNESTESRLLALLLLSDAIPDPEEACNCLPGAPLDPLFRREAEVPTAEDLFETDAEDGASRLCDEEGGFVGGGGIQYVAGCCVCCGVV